MKEIKISDISVNEKKHKKVIQIVPLAFFNLMSSCFKFDSLSKYDFLISFTCQF
jgi:hypothetical protein